MTIRDDDRTEEQKRTHTWLVTATDRFMSGWGLCANEGVSKCAWACETRHVQEVFEWVNGRSEMKYVNVHMERGFDGDGKKKGWYPRAAHVHIYVVTEGHTSLQ